MQIARIKYVGTTGATFTNNAVYDVVSWSGSTATVKGDNDTVQGVALSSPDWELEYLAVMELKQLYP
jgi:hypothetical protein